MTDYAIIETQGKQQRIVPGSTILVDLDDRKQATRSSWSRCCWYRDGE
jgi:ribosomal protein L21